MVFGVVEHFVKGFHRVAGKAYSPNQPLLLQGKGCRNRLFPDLRQLHEFNIVKEQHIQIVRSQTM